MTARTEDIALLRRMAGEEKKRRRAIENHDEQMRDAEGQCVPCRLCGGTAIITDAGPGWGYSIHCSGAAPFSKPSCLQSGTRISGWAYNVSDLWNSINTVTEAADAIAALGDGVVKPLQWGPYPNPVFDGPDIAVANIEIFGLMFYQVQRDPSAPGYMAFLAPKLGTLFWESKGHANLASAKDAAQSDCAARILSALSGETP